MKGTQTIGHSPLHHIHQVLEGSIVQNCGTAIGAPVYLRQKHMAIHSGLSPSFIEFSGKSQTDSGQGSYIRIPYTILNPCSRRFYIECCRPLYFCLPHFHQHLRYTLLRILFCRFCIVAFVGSCFSTRQK